VSARRFPRDFLLGCASAAHQVEGGNDNDWARWERDHPERIADGSSSQDACDHYRRYRDDLTALAALHQNAHRFSVEWSRVEKEPGCFDRGALNHYADVVRTCRELGMEPVVTLHHFTFPVWLAARGGAAHADAPRLFARYAAACATAFGSDITWWITINEPAVLACQAHLTGEWPPGERSLRSTLATLRGLLRMHAAAYHALHAVALRNGSPARVSIAHHERRLTTRRGRHLDRLAARLPDVLFNRWFLRCCASGRLLPPLGDAPPLPGLRDSLDYIGLNYYCEDTVRFDRTSPQTLFTGRVSEPGRVLSDFGWPIDAPGLRSAIDALWGEFRLPILITENGVADSRDALRPAYIADHLNAVLDAIDDGADVRGYLHWTAWDNFEWAEGYTKRFGLYAVDRTTQERTPRPSAALYAGICATGEVPGVRSSARELGRPG